MGSPSSVVKLTIFLFVAIARGMMPSRIHQNELHIDTFHDSPVNDLGYWHGPGENLMVEYDYDEQDDSFVRLFPSDPDNNYHTQLSDSCVDLTDYNDMYLHLSFSGSKKFSISLYQHNGDCDSHRAPYPGTFDSVEASRYASHGEIYIPLSHFYIDFSRVSSIAFHGFYTREEVVLRSVEIVDDIPEHVRIARKLPTGTMVLTCKRPDSFAFGIDDGDPQLAQEVMRILDDENIKVTFFVVGKGLLDESTNLTNVYAEMLQRGHQVALHSYSHPKMEGLRRVSDIDYQIRDGYYAIKDLLGIHSRYFRPPYGTVGARTRQRLAAFIHNPYIVNWSVDIEDWLWADTDEEERQLEAFRRDIDRGGDIVVMHYLSWSTVQYFKDVIQMARETGKQIMRIDQCMMDPEAPSLPDEEDDWMMRMHTEQVPKRIPSKHENKSISTPLSDCLSGSTPHPFLNLLNCVTNSNISLFKLHPISILTNIYSMSSSTPTDNSTTPQSQPAENTPSHLNPSTYPRTAHLASENIYLELTYSSLDPNQILHQVSSPSAGANVLFLGTTRDTFESRAVSQLSYTSYAPLALKTLTQIAQDAKTEYNLIGISIAHRLGVVPIGEASIAIAVSAAHRGPAWRAGEQVLETCKLRLEVWKREEFVGQRPEEGEWRANKDRDAEGRRMGES
ncbi:putative polysaccharide deacetylase [Talaromyces proteolyticus]|uniref:Molybdopterin synthase catalytic subunit n=1 Tax=Talaromyces proteolyticus TaxID=1131652 RepID=A0AAD4KEN9_9EURO|nr:putative polysaccharide deacetylase [Talaromyces proteolyticus]KAH8690539.1 putative polysaccharide deacetylase [Talaromyces proteolyticus]